MDPGKFANLVEAAIGTSIGLYCTALGRRWVGKAPGASPEYDVWHRKYGTMLAWVGPFLVALAWVLYFANHARPAP